MTLDCLFFKVCQVECSDSQYEFQRCTQLQNRICKGETIPILKKNKYYLKNTQMLNMPKILFELYTVMCKVLIYGWDIIQYKILWFLNDYSETRIEAPICQ